ncbi:MAG: hypothetical protein IT428_31525 [Planctomycetaceae bacterium]|nr:hypothetical protein [Planctomycetaceae bacterium]
MAAGYTQITYNGVQIRHVQTRNFRQEPQFDPSGSNLSHYRYTIRVAGLLTGGTGTLDHFVSAGAFTATGDPAGTYRAMRVALAARRGVFEMRMGVIPGSSAGVVVLRADPYTDRASPQNPDLDVENGPKCTVIEPVHIVANECFRVECEFEINVRGCAPDDAEAAAILWNSWGVVDEIDQNLTTTRTTAGTLRSVSGALNANSFRELCIPKLQPGMMRKSISCEVSRDGLTLAWSCVDQEAIYSAPAPATNWNFRHTESTGDGITMSSEVSVMMEGPRDVDRRELVQLCVAFGYTKLKKDRGDNRIKAIFNFLSVTEESGSSANNRVYMEMRATQPLAGKNDVPLNANQAAGVIFGGIKARLGDHVDASAFGNQAPNYDPDRSRGGRDAESPFVEGPSSRWGAFVSYLQCPCCENHAVGDKPSDSVGVQHTPQGDEPPVSIRTVESISIEKPEYLSDAHMESMYVFWQADTTIDCNDGYLALPVARSASVGTSQDQENAATVKIVRLHPEIAKRTVRIAGERVGERPQLPDMKTFTDDNGVVHTRLKRIVKPATSARTPDGQELFRVDAEYVFAMSRAPKDGEQIAIAENPFDTLGLQKTQIGPASQNQSGLPEGQS